MQNYGQTTVAEFLEDLIVYRNLIAVDERLPSLDSIRAEISLSDGHIPRKTDPDYARVVAHLLHLARAIDMPRVKIERLIFIGDINISTQGFGFCLQFRQSVRGIQSILMVADGDFRSLLRQSQSNGAANTFRRTGYHGNFPCQGFCG